ncbi:MAG: hypothetical protein JNJ41_11340 [Bacteroidia bacterium]|nr:hypothetical protein [Bacteroidia bacterium]
MNILIVPLIGIVGLAIWGLSKVAKVGNNIVTEIKAKIFSVNFSSIRIDVDVKVKNPSNSRATVKHPFVKISFKDKVIGSSEVIDKTYNIEPLSQFNLLTTQIPVQLFSLGPLAAELVKKAQDKKYPITLQITIQTSAVVLGANIPYTDTQDITI